MAGKILGQTDITSAATNTTIATVPANFWWAFTANFCNRTTNLVKIRLAVAAAASPTNAEWMIYEYEMQPYETFDKTGLVAQAAKLIVCRADIANAISVNIYGMEDPV